MTVVIPPARLRKASTVHQELVSPLALTDFWLLLKAVMTETLLMGTGAPPHVSSSLAGSVPLQTHRALWLAETPFSFSLTKSVRIPTQMTMTDAHQHVRSRTDGLSLLTGQSLKTVLTL